MAGDLVDLASLGSAMAKNNNSRGRIITATTAVIGVTALDLICSQRMSESSEATRPEEKGVQETRSIIVDRPADEVLVAGPAHEAIVPRLQAPGFSAIF